MTDTAIEITPAERAERYRRRQRAAARVRLARLEGLERRFGDIPTEALRAARHDAQSWDDDERKGDLVDRETDAVKADGSSLRIG